VSGASGLRSPASPQGGMCWPKCWKLGPPFFFFFPRDMSLERGLSAFSRCCLRLRFIKIELETAPFFDHAFLFFFKLLFHAKVYVLVAKVQRDLSYRFSMMVRSPPFHTSRAPIMNVPPFPWLQFAYKKVRKVGGWRRSDGRVILSEWSSFSNSPEASLRSSR